MLVKHARVITCSVNMYCNYVLDDGLLSNTLKQVRELDDAPTHEHWIKIYQT